tara:strand:- start:259 stop:483 length:225 start_codon:yes stop_codon:yes gene_type:complete
MDVDINGKRKLTFLADEGYQAIVMELLGKQEITGHNFNILIRGLLLDAWTKGEGKPVVINRSMNMVCVDPLQRE